MGSSISGNVTSTFSTIAVSGQSDIVADSGADTLTMVGSGVTLTTNASTDTLTITGVSSPTIGDTQVAIATAANTLGGTSGFTCDDATNVVAVTALAATGGNAALATLNVVGSGAAALVPMFQGVDPIALVRCKTINVDCQAQFGVLATDYSTDPSDAFVMYQDAGLGWLQAGSGTVGVHVVKISFDPTSGNQIAITAGTVQHTGTTLLVGPLTLFGAAAVMRTDTTDGHTALLQAYDVNGTTYRTFLTLTNGDVPDCTISAPSGGTMTLQPSTYKSSDGSSGVSAGPFTALTGITVKNGLVVSLSGT